MNLDHHLQYLQNMVEILHSFHQVPAHPNQVFMVNEPPIIAPPSPPSPVLPEYPPRLVRSSGSYSSSRLENNIFRALRQYLTHELESWIHENIPLNHDHSFDYEDDELLELEIELTGSFNFSSNSANVSSNVSRVYDPSHLENAGKFVDRVADQTECSICFEECQEGDIFSTKCKHIFHPKCLHAWLNRKENCPVCRHSLSAAS